MKGQEVIESPLDTLTRSVQVIQDELRVLKRLKITGYVQPQWQYIDSAGAPSVAGGAFVSDQGGKYYSRFMMRRGRFKFTYDFENVQLVVNTDATEKGLNMRETYAKVTDPWLHMFSLTAGLLQVQFGFEVTQSSSVRETPERARFNQTLFPTERDLGIFGSMVVPKTSRFYGLKVDVAVMNGVGSVAPEFDSHKDFSGRIQYSKTIKSEKVTWAIGASGYHGGYRVGSFKDFRFKTLDNGEKGYAYAVDTANYNRVAKRNYVGADGQISFDWLPGITTLRADYVTGEQPGVSTSSTTLKVVPAATVYHRIFNGAYFYFIQNIGQTKFQAVAKYDWYDPNIEVSGKNIGKAGTNTNAGDIRFDTYGFGLTYRINAFAKITAYYDWVINEETLVKGYEKDIKDNVTTIRFQVRF
ncbi:MAG TPA: hypothetical protein VFF27_06650 [Bacteroidia bacterium]|nr:hypothetical protein [Bacteroidia bacterium]